MDVDSPARRKKHGRDILLDVTDLPSLLILAQYLGRTVSNVHVDKDFGN
jgi:hypothetical protein